MTTKKLNQLKNMLDGWKNVFISDEEVEALAQERGEVCAQCPHKKRFTCALCDCPLKAKLRSPHAECPDNRWVR